MPSTVSNCASKFLPSPFASAGPGHNAYEETDFHQLEEDRFAAETAELLRKRALRNEFESLIVVAPLWPYQHTLPETSHYADGLWGALMENSLAVLLIVLVSALPWRPGAEPAFRPQPWIAPRQARKRRVRGS